MTAEFGKNDTSVSGLTSKNKILAGQIDAQKAKISTLRFDMIYPIGSIYISVSSINPSALFGGNWAQWGAGRVPVCVNASNANFNTVEKTGGEENHTLNVNEMPSHNHAIPFGPAGSTYAAPTISSSLTDRGDIIRNTGGGQAHNNLQPYVTCYMFKRTA